MNTYEYLLTEAGSEGLVVKELPLRGYDGRIKGNRVAISKNLTQAQKSCVLAEELGHHYTTVGNILDQSDAGNRKQEFRSRLWAYNKNVGLQGIIKAYEKNLTSFNEVAEFLEVSPDFLFEALECYRGKYGCYVEVDNYVIIFEPYLSVVKMI